MNTSINKPLISIAMTTYNGENFLCEQIDSILSQSYQNFELIICDDCSTDKTPEILQKYQQKDSRISIFFNKDNVGFTKNFEQALLHCSADYIALCDQDDIWYSNHLEILFQNIGNNDCIGGNSEFIDENGKNLGIKMSDFLQITKFPQNNGDIYFHELYNNMIQGTASLFRKDLLKSVIPIPNEIKFHDYWIALNACINNGCTYLNVPVLKYRRHTSNVTEYEKFSLIKSIKKIHQLSQNKQTYYGDWIALLNHLSEKKMSALANANLQDALIFYKNLYENKHRFSSFLFYLKNYRKITLGKFHNILPLGFRSLSFLVFGIKY